MDILDIDEALKDDSYIFLADRSHDDVSNILQQWKTNNQTQMQMQLPYSNEQAYKLNSKTFTRPKRRSQAAQNLETQFTQNASVPGTTTPAMLQLEIGGLVTTNTNMHNKSYLQDTSPPSSLCSSMNNDRMNNSLITSADFSNLNFLQSTASLEQELNLTTTLTNFENIGGGGGVGGDGGLGGYSLSDMIRDRKALETLTMCDDDGTLIKDSHIGQIDEISLTMSKTASGCSTMDNSTDSMSNPLAIERNVPICNALQRTMILSEEMIGDTTFNLVDSLTTPTTDSESLPAFDGSLTFKRPNRAPALNETLVLASRQVNTTFTEGCDTPEARCETPENVDKKLAALNMESSTPLTTHSMRSHYHHNNNNNNNKTGYTPTIKGGRNEEVNLSPIVGTPQRLNTTYEPTPKMAPFDGEKFVMDTMELLEQIEQPLDGTYNMSEEHKQMQCVMDLAEAEVELLAQQGDEEQFENMLAEISKVNLNAEQLKMQKSLDSIKKRFHKDDGGDQQEEHQQQQLEEQQQLETERDRVETTPNHSHSFGSTNGAANGSGGAGAAANGSSSSSGGGKERLLSRRSRLYDDLNLSSMQGSNNSSNSCNSTSFIVQRRDDHHHHHRDQADEEEQQQQQQQRYQVDNNGENNSHLHTEVDPPSFKLAERRERDRERFRTIKITREMRQEQEQEHDIIVPCIDDEQHQQELEQQENPELERQPSPPGRLSRRDQNPVFNNNKTEISSNNFLTYKKPKEKSLISRRPLPEAHHYQPHQQEVPATSSTTSVLPQPRSLSRPRYISGLQKFTTVSKATSAGAGLNAAPPAAPVSTVPTGATGELKSPMGIKSKSFHNLSSNIGGGAAALTRPSLGGGLRRPGVQPSKLRGASQQAPEEDPSVFKVPKLVSGLRGPAQGGGAKRIMGNGLARPSSGYYSLSVKPAPEADTPESLSSASSRGSLYGKDMKAINGGVGGANHHPSALDAQTLTSKLTQVTTGATGIPKPSGLRQPTQMKRSGLPRPSSIVRR